MIFKNTKGIAKYWGSPSPAQLEAVFRHLCFKGFDGPLSWNDPIHFSFDRPIDDDLFSRVCIDRIGEFPRGFFNFDASILICSRAVAEIESKLDLWERSHVSIEYEGKGPYSVLLSITLSHIKWNTNQGPNPYWSVFESRSSETSNNRFTWLEDWDIYGEPFLNQFVNAESVVRYMLAMGDYKSSPWVKSDGPKSASKLEFVTILLCRIGRESDAIQILKNTSARLDALLKSGDVSRAAKCMKERIDKLTDWCNKFVRN